MPLEGSPFAIAESSHNLASVRWATDLLLDNVVISSGRHNRWQWCGPCYSQSAIFGVVGRVLSGKDRKLWHVRVLRVLRWKWLIYNAGSAKTLNRCYFFFVDNVSILSKYLKYNIKNAYINKGRFSAINISNSSTGSRECLGLKAVTGCFKKVQHYNLYKLIPVAFQRLPAWWGNSNQWKIDKWQWMFL